VTGEGECCEPAWLDDLEIDAWRRLAAVLTVLPSELDAQMQKRADLNQFEYHVLSYLSEAGGSSLGNLLVRLDPDLRAYASDHHVDYRTKEPWELDHCEIVPGLAPLAPQINDFSTAAIPVLRVRYGYGRRKWFGLERRESRRILDFFVENLEATSACQ
jgi:hypothetical protein